MRSFLIALLLLGAATAHAQQQPTLDPAIAAEALPVCENNRNTLLTLVDRSVGQIAVLQKQIAQLQEKIRELEKKPPAP